ncbi:MAG: putative aminohydrolase SsnA [Chloroflexota bacterium]|nr:putative aminohydrolase SsnA [Chloroflexota bacterium]
MLITHGTLVTMNRHNEIIFDGALRIEGERIAEVGKTADLRRAHPDEKELDAEGRLVMPGLICAHTHFYGAFARGMAIPGEAPVNFPQILERLWWQLDKALDLEGSRYSALVCLVDAVRHGMTTLVDHHASPNAIDGSLDVVAEATLQAGVRACLCYEVTDRDGLDKMQAGVDENVRLITRARKEANPLLAGTFGLHASLTLSDASLEKCAAAAQGMGVGVHIHVAEDKADQEDSLKRSGRRVVERLQKLGMLGAKTITAHCVHVNERELDILQETGTNVVHNPRSNQNNAVGTADVPLMLERGIRVGLGNDGFSNNMFTEMHACYLIHKLNKHDPRVMGADTVLKMAFGHNAEIAGLFFPGPLGVLESGALADVILVDYHPTTPLNAGNLPWHIIFGVDGTGVDTTIVGGKILMRHRELLTLDEEAITARSRESAAETWRRVQG